MWQQLYRLTCGVQHYPWGERQTQAGSPYIAKLLGHECPRQQPYAELWMGAHSRLPATLHLSDRSVRLDQAIREHPSEILGSRLYQAGVRSLPFLLKILSCDAPLSIQAHPDKALAEQLHQHDPEHYPDDNHKPEVAIALTPFTALSQFRHPAEILGDMPRLPALQQFLGCVKCSPQDPNWLRAAYGHIFAACEAEIAAAIQGIRSELGRTGQHEDRDTCFLQLAAKCPGDPGSLSAYFLNYLALQPGDAFYMAANEPHAYLQGAIIECMANSDNVVRAGLTAKFIDQDVLIQMLTYQAGKPKVWQGELLPEGGTSYRVPAREFCVDIRTGETGDVQSVTAESAVSIMLVLEGRVRFEIPGAGAVCGERGSVWLWPGALPEVTIVFDGPNSQVVQARPNPKVS